MWPHRLQLTASPAPKQSYINLPPVIFSKTSSLSWLADDGPYMANQRDRQDSSRWSRSPQPEMPVDEPSAYRANSTRLPQGQSDLLLTPPPSGTSKHGQKEKKKPASLRYLIKRRPEEGAGHVRSASLSPHHAVEPVQSAPPTATAFPDSVHRSVSQPPSMERAVSHQQASPPTEYFDMSFADPGPTTTWIPRASQTFPQTSWEPSPIESQPASRFSRQPPRADTAPASTRRPPAARQQSGADSFDSPEDFHLFVEATSGFSSSGFSLTSPQTPPRSRPQPFSYQAAPQLPPLPQLIVPPPEPPQPPREAQHSYYHQQHHHPDYYQYGMSHSAVEPTTSQSFAQSLDRIGSYDDEAPPDDELPDYAQSQADAQAARRREAAQRAAELERQWANSRRRY